MRKLINMLLKWLTSYKPPVVAPEAPIGSPPSWDKCTKASCWQGSNAQTRHMNCLSPKMPEGEFKRRIKWAVDEGCNTVHLYLSNEGDGEYAGYSIYGASWGSSLDKAFIKLAKSRIEYARRQGLAVVLWLFADDSGGFAAKGRRMFDRYVRDLEANGLFEHASIRVVGLEIETYFSHDEVKSLVEAMLYYHPSPVGVHQSSYRVDYADLADIFFYQVKPGHTEAWLVNEAARVRRTIYKPLCFFEIERQESSKCAAILAAGDAFSVGNWRKP